MEQTGDGRTEIVEYKVYEIEVPVFKDGRYDCPFCGKTRVIDTQNGLSQHFSNTHDIGFPLRECENDQCDETFRPGISEPEQTYCSQDCANEALGRGRKNRTQKKCAHPECDEELDLMPSRVKERNYCSIQHANEDKARLRQQEAVPDGGEVDG